jgi:alpha-methylacyl-CoA racemase
MPDPSPSKPARTPAAFKPLKGVTVLSLALNLPGPAALMRCRQLGARCVKLEPPAPQDAPAHVTGDPMSLYSPSAYTALHEGIRTRATDLKTEAGQRALHRELVKADVLLTSFRPSALTKLGLGWKALRQQYPTLSQIAIVGGPGALAEVPGHDLTYLAENDLLTGLDLPATLYADMGGSLMAVEAVLQAVLHRATKAKGIYLEVALSNAASWLGLPRAWGLTKPGAAVGGGHAGYRVYACKDGRVAVAALEPHFAARLCEAAGVVAAGPQTMFKLRVHETIESFFRSQTCSQLESIAEAQDIPLHTLQN